MSNYDQVIVIVRRLGKPDQISAYGVDEEHQRVADRIKSFIQWNIKHWWPNNKCICKDGERCELCDPGG